MATKAKQKSPKQKDISAAVAKSLRSYIKGVDNKKLEKKVKKFSKEFGEQLNKAIAKSKKKVVKSVSKKTETTKVVKKATAAKAKS